VGRSNGFDKLSNVFVDHEVCEGNGLCAEACPVEVYDLVETRAGTKAQPTRANDCILCMACVDVCPTGAITVQE
jgi:NAD-dependent dihydropyrimidine dehydrogenase PreA subunit